MVLASRAPQLLLLLPLLLHHADSAPCTPPPAEQTETVTAASARDLVHRAINCSLLTGWVIEGVDVAAADVADDVRLSIYLLGGHDGDFGAADSREARASAARMLGVPTWRLLRCSAVPLVAVQGHGRVVYSFTVWNGAVKDVDLTATASDNDSSSDGLPVWASVLMVCVTTAVVAGCLGLWHRRRRRRSGSGMGRRRRKSHDSESQGSDRGVESGIELLERVEDSRSCTPRRSATPLRSPPRSPSSGAAGGHSPGRLPRTMSNYAVPPVPAAIVGTAGSSCGGRCDSDVVLPPLLACCCCCFCLLLTVFFTRGPWCWTSIDEMGLLGDLTSREGRPGTTAVPLLRAHSHNDYLQPRPLSAALQAGFCSVEADVWYRKGKLLLGHEYATEQTLYDAYLLPMATLVRRNGGRVLPLSEPLGLCRRVTLLIDMKTPTVSTWHAVERELRRAEEEARSRGTFGCGGQDGAVEVVLSGFKNGRALLPFAHHMITDVERCAWLDGRDSSSRDGPTRALSRLVSRSARHVLGWSVVRAAVPPHRLSGAEEAKLRRWAAEVKASGARSRLWGTPDSPEVWQQLIAAGVDVIGSDHIAELRAFFLGGGAARGEVS